MAVHEAVHNHDHYHDDIYYSDTMSRPASEIVDVDVDLSLGLWISGGLGVEHNTRGLVSFGRRGTEIRHKSIICMDGDELSFIENMDAIHRCPGRLSASSTGTSVSIVAPTTASKRTTPSDTTL